MNDRFRDTGGWIFWRDILVVCPRCAGTAVVLAIESKLRCGCGLALDAPPGPRSQTRTAPAHDARFGLPLRLQITVGAPRAGHGHVLWAYNLRHLAVLRDYFGAKLRERAAPRGKTELTTLPRWVKRMSRAQVLAALDTMRARYERSGPRD